MSAQAAIDAIPATDDWGVHAAEVILSAAAACSASDVHLHSQRSGVQVRVRVHDMLASLATIPLSRRDLLIARFKVLARLPAFIRNEPQDGRIEWKGIDTVLRTLRVSFLPTIHGESLVIRFPETTGALLTLNELGVSSLVRTGIERLLALTEGTILVTGPSGSGKTTTLYALLTELHAQRGDRLNFLTIEDPVERELPFAAQVQVLEAQGMTFEKALRASLRQDPNVLLIGEVRDAETAKICVQAGMTGHLVFSTLHAGRVSSVFTRLLSMGLPPYLADPNQAPLVLTGKVSDVETTTTFASRGDGTWLLTVVAGRKTAEGLATASLSTIIEGATP